MDINFYTIELLVQYAVYFIGLYILVFFLLLYLQYKPHLYKKLKPKVYPTLSVIIPAHNEEHRIARCIESVLDAEYPKNKLEILVIDDGSTDNTYNEALKFKGRNVRVFQKPKGGKATALNYGIARAKGELVATMDADSYILKDTIAKLLPLLNDSDVMAVTPAVKVRPVKTWIREVQRIEYLLIIFARRLLNFVDGVPVTPGPFSMFRAKMFKKIGVFDEKNIVEDHEMALRIQSHNYKILSSLEAEVYTETPDTLKELVMQRVRWHRGGLHNTLRYGWMISPKYGDFGVFVLPLVLVSVITLVLIMTFTIWHVLNPPLYFSVLGAEAFLLSINPFTVLAILILILSLIWVYLGVHSFKREQASIPWLIFYLLFYWYLMVAYNVITFFKEIIRQELRWETR